MSDNKDFVIEKGVLQFYKGKDKDVVIPSGVTKITSSTFAMCNDIQSVTLPEGITSIPYGTFSWKKELRSVHLPQSLTTIASDAFEGCSSLKYIEIPKNVTQIGSNPFKGCSSMINITVEIGNEYLHACDNCLIETKKKRLLAGSVVGKIPSDGSVTSIASNAFRGYAGLRNIDIPESVSYIGSFAFADCPDILSVSLPQSITRIENGAFSGCKSLTHIAIPSGVTEISERIFEECSGLESIVFSDNVQHIHHSAFRDCTNLKLTQYDNAMYFGNFENPYLVLQSAINRDINSCEIHPSTRVVLGEAFYECQNLTSIIIPEGVTILQDNAFAGCCNLKNVSIPDSLIYMGYGVFRLCDALQMNEYDTARYLGNNQNPYIVLMSSVDKDISSCRINENTRHINHYAFEKCIKLENITIPNSVINIGEYAFEDCQGLSDVCLPQHLTKLRRGVFFKCEGLNSIVIPNSVALIGTFAFRECSGLKDISISDSVKTIDDSAFEDCRSLTSVEIPSNVTCIGYGAFCRCQGLTEVSVAGEDVDFGYNAFGNCSNLIRFTYPGTSFDYEAVGLSEKVVLAMENYDLSSSNGKSLVDKVKKNKKILYKELIFTNSGLVMSRFLSFWKKVSLDDLEMYLNESMQANCPESTAVLLEYRRKHYSVLDEEQRQEDNALKTLGIKERSLADLRKIFKIAIREGTAVITQYIGEDTYVEIPEKAGKNPVTKLDVRAFANQRSLTGIVLNENLKSIERAAFENCPALTHVTIPKGVVSIGDYVFERCTQLATIEVDSRNKYYKSIEGVLYDSSVATLNKCPSAKQGKLEIPCTVQYVKQYACCQCERLTEISIPDGVTVIEASTFSHCSQMRTIHMPENALSKIDKFAFLSCIQLSEFILKNGAEKILWQAFAECRNLTRVELGIGTEMLGKEVFLNCEKLADIYMPSSLTKIGEDCFNGCPNLTIHAPAGSYAEQYAKENNIPFVAEG